MVFCVDLILKICGFYFIFILNFKLGGLEMFSQTSDFLAKFRKLIPWGNQVSQCCDNLAAKLLSFRLV